MAPVGGNVYGYLANATSGDIQHLQARAVLEALLDKYADEGVRSLENPKVLKLKPFDEIGTPVEIINRIFGGKTNYEQAVQELEQELFKQDESA